MRTIEQVDRDINRSISKLQTLLKEKTEIQLSKIDNKLGVRRANKDSEFLRNEIRNNLFK